MDIIITQYLENSAFLALFLVVVCIAKWLYNLLTSYNTFEQIIEKRNTALAVSIAGFIIAVTMIYIAVLKGPSRGLINDLINVGLYSAMGLGMLFLARLINDKLLLSKFCNHQQIIEHQRLSVGIVQSASYIAAGLVIAGSLTGEGSLISAVVFYVLGQITLLIFSKVYDLITRFEFQHEIEKGNVAAAVSFAATKIALGIILLHALVGGFNSWFESISLFFIDAIIALILLPLVRIVVDIVLLPKIKIDDAIEAQNTAVAIIEGFVAISVAAVIFYTL
ncbi:DUF350 domain-containing protein [Catenovulum sediminis]|uniref:DUF350 domain-containing protein n=1 Tax=Catenovulum sediminis TaxID=1740262 RepID=A0ABV1RDX4_9ALTE|nr:DUF350 domain-containing protein [Catenovulum sediminis]